MNQVLINQYLINPLLPTTYPIYIQNFEAGTTLAAACPEFIDFDSAYGINTVVANSFVGNRSLKLVSVGGSHSIFSNVSDSLSGNIRINAYVLCGTSTSTVSIFARQLPVGVSTSTSYVRMLFGTTGIVITQLSGGVTTTLNTPISGVTVPVGIWLCLELQCNGTTLTARVIRQDSGQFFVNTGTGSWSATPQTQTVTTAVTGAGGFGFRHGDTVSCYTDYVIYNPAIPTIDYSTLRLNSGVTQQLTGGGFSDPAAGINYLSSTPSIATVSSTGLVTGVSAGTATITAGGNRDAGQTATSATTVLGSRLSQLPIEILRGRDSTATSRISQMDIEIIRGGISTAKSRISQIDIEVLMSIQQNPSFIIKRVGSYGGLAG